MEVQRVQVEWLPGDLRGLVLTGDLQAREVGPQRRLAGEALAEELEMLGELGELPALRDMGVVLAGDLYTGPNLDRRGQAGDVRSVWRAFARQSRFVAGVAGNHDLFGTPQETAQFAGEPEVYLLDGSRMGRPAGLRIGGVGGIVGSPDRPNRRDEHSYLAVVGMLMKQEPDILVTHEAPGYPGQGRPGRDGVGRVLESMRKGLVVCGHVHWDEPLLGLPEGGQVLNVHGRVLVLTV
jgi:hypothetical protein